MTKKRIWLMLLTALAISVVIVACSMAANITHPDPTAQETTEPATTQTSVSFVLKIWEGQLGLFRGDSDTPYRQLDMPLNLLSDYDRELLEQGIEVNTEEEMRKLVEDITS